jgi:hypothetical protein
MAVTNLEAALSFDFVSSDLSYVLMRAHRALKYLTIEDKKRKV